MTKIKVQSINMDIVKADGAPVALVFDKELPEMDINETIKLVVYLAKSKEAEGIIVPFTLTIGGKENHMGTSKNFFDYAKSCGIVAIPKTLINKGENKMNKETVVEKVTAEVAATVEVKATESKMDKAKEIVENAAKEIKLNGEKVIAKGDKVLEVIAEKLADIVEIGEALEDEAAAGERAKVALKDLKTIMAEAKEEGWLHTLKAIAVWVCRKTWAIAKGIGKFTWSTVKAIGMGVYAIGAEVVEAFKEDVLETVKKA